MVSNMLRSWTIGGRMKKCIFSAVSCVCVEGGGIGRE
jgi:hypothetical protein